jgi:uncharacterized membrane protein YfcA
VEIAATALVLCLAAFTQGFLGFGFGIIAMGALSVLHDPWHAAGVVNITGLLQTAWLAMLLRRSIQWGVVRRILPAAALGVAVGLLALGRLPEAILLRVLGATIVGFSLWNLSRWRPAAEASPRWDAPVGFASGVLTGMFNTGGPPIIAHLYRRPEPPEVLIATVQACFLFSALTRLPGAYAMNMLTPAVWHHAVVSAAFVIAGVWGGRLVGQRLSPERFRGAGWTALGLLGAWITWAA